MAVHFECYGATVDVGPVWPRVERADCYQSACSNLGLIAGTNLYSHRANQGQKKKPLYHFIQMKHAVCLFLSFFSSSSVHRATGLLSKFSWLPLGDTCQLLPIGMFEPGPYGRDPKCTTRGLGGNHKVWILSFHHDKIRTLQTLFFPTCSSQVRIGPLPLQAFLCFFFLVFFFGSVWPPVEHTNWYQSARSTWGQPGLNHKKKKKKKKKTHLFFS